MSDAAAAAAPAPAKGAPPPKGAGKGSAGKGLSYKERKEAELQEMEDKLSTYDKSGTGALSKTELKDLLVDLNNGAEVQDQEVDWVMAEADIFGDGQIHKTELVMAIAAWYSHVEGSKGKSSSKMCALL
mmetsp:Transcript_38440/g.104109  ORF Transcript_38440/g.104109 Transcript_38440/m.104109 type:complete len:129 (-) Transcript_38440:54-440(-)